jgi:hypothetical protein
MAARTPASPSASRLHDPNPALSRKPNVVVSRIRIPVVTRDSGLRSCQGRYPQELAKIPTPPTIPTTVMKTSRRRAIRSSFHPRNQGSLYIGAASRASSLARRDTDSAWRDTRTRPTALNSTTPAPTTTPSNHIVPNILVRVRLRLWLLDRNAQYRQAVCPDEADKAKGIRGREHRP